MMHKMVTRVQGEGYMEFYKDDFFQIVDLFYHEIKKDGCSENNGLHRYASWEYCYVIFQEMIEKKKQGFPLKDEDYDYLALHLGFYLASWGMYRGSSFLLSKSYKVHIESIKCILEALPSDNFNDIRDYLLADDSGMMDRLADIYKVRPLISNNDDDLDLEGTLTDTLFTKIMLGTIGCIPAFDRYCKLGLKAVGISPTITSRNNNFFNSSFISCFKDNYVNCNKYVCRSSSMINSKEYVYPPMKIMDMFLFELGRINEAIISIKNLMSRVRRADNNDTSKWFRESMKAVGYLYSINICLYLNNCYVEEIINKVSDNEISIFEIENILESISCCNTIDGITEQMMNMLNENERENWERKSNKVNGCRDKHVGLFLSLIDYCVSLRQSVNRNDLNSNKERVLCTIGNYEQSSI